MTHQQRRLINRRYYPSDDVAAILAIPVGDKTVNAVATAASATAATNVQRASRLRLDASASRAN